VSEQLKRDIVGLTHEMGFEAAGFTTPEPVDGNVYCRWLERGYAGSMAYLQRNMDKRFDPRLLVPGVRSILCVGINYFQSQQEEPLRGGRVSLYAWGTDYHVVVKNRLHQLAEKLREFVDRDFHYRVFVDSAPVMEKSLAQRAGLGWIGKNGCLINRDFGSFLFLGELFLDFEVPADEPETNRCGECKKCIENCPMGAIVEPGLLDARRCISYLTIEHAGPIDPALADRIGEQIFGCDRCQRVCPFNGRCVETKIAEFRKHKLGRSIEPEEILGWNAEDWKQRTSESAGARASLEQWRRNAEIVRGNRIQK